MCCEASALNLGFSQYYLWGGIIVMRSLLIRLFAAVPVLFAVEAPIASASVTYQFIQESAILPPSLPPGTNAVLHIEMTFADESSFANGFKQSLNPGSGSLNGLLDLNISGIFIVPVTEATLLSIVTACPGAAPGGCVGDFRVASFGLSPTTGAMFYNDTQQDFTFRYGDGRLEVTRYGTDVGPFCVAIPQCSFSGLWVQVPGPSTIGLVGVGFILLAARKRRLALRETTATGSEKH